jgi:uncharacterized membrane protein
MKNWKIWCFLTALTAFLCCVQVPVFAKIAATQVNGKTEIFRRQLVAAQNLQSAGLYRQACNTLLPVLERGDFDCLNLINNPIYPR